MGFEFVCSSLVAGGVGETGVLTAGGGDSDCRRCDDDADGGGGGELLHGIASFRNSNSESLPSALPPTTVKKKENIFF